MKKAEMMLLPSYSVLGYDPLMTGESEQAALDEGSGEVGDECCGVCWWEVCACVVEAFRRLLCGRNTTRPPQHLPTVAYHKQTGSDKHSIRILSKDSRHQSVSAGKLSRCNRASFTKASSVSRYCIARHDPLVDSIDTDHYAALKYGSVTALKLSPSVTRLVK